MEGLDLVDSHDPRDTVLAAGLTRFTQIEEDARRTVDAMARRVGFADQGEQPLIFLCAIRERMTQPFVKPTAGYLQQSTHHRGVELFPVCFDKGVPGSDTLWVALTTHRTSSYSGVGDQKVSVKIWEVHFDPISPVRCT